MRIGKAFSLLPAVILAALPLVAQETTPESPPAGKSAILLQIEGPIGPATSDYIERGLNQSSARNAELVIIRMDTPGGLDTSMRSIIKQIIASPVPVVTYVAPGGARAASAGTYILYASHIAAMAPATNLGSATPVQISSPAGIDDFRKKPGTPESSEDEKPGGESGKDVMTQKIVNDAAAYIRGLAKMRGRNEEWAEEAVRSSASLPAEEALRLNVIDMISPGTNELLVALDGRRVNVLGQEITLHTTGLPLERIDPDWRAELLAVITNPNIAYVLMLIGIYGLIFELSNPGAVLPGTIGAICLLLALYAFQVLPVNYAGLALILLGIALMVGEAFMPSFGALGLGGVVAFAIGSVILMDTDAPGFGIDLALVGAFTLTSAILFILAMGLILKARKNPVVSGREEMIGGIGTAIADFDGKGSIRIHSETWSARTSAPLRKGDKARVKAMDGLTLMVTPLTEEQEKETK